MPLWLVYSLLWTVKITIVFFDVRDLIWFVLNSLSCTLQIGVCDKPRQMLHLVCSHLQDRKLLPVILNASYSCMIKRRFQKEHKDIIFILGEPLYQTSKSWLTAMLSDALLNSGHCTIEKNKCNLLLTSSNIITANC